MVRNKIIKGVNKMQYKDLYQKLDTYNSIPRDDLNTRLNTEPPPPIPVICRTCEEQYTTFALSWDDISINRRNSKGDNDYSILGYCPKHSDLDDEDDD